MGMIEGHDYTQQCIDTLVSLKDQLDVIEKCRVGDTKWHLIFDNNDEFWILKDGLPIYRSED